MKERERGKKESEGEREANREKREQNRLKAFNENTKLSRVFLPPSNFRKKKGTSVTEQLE